MTKKNNIQSVKIYKPKDLAKIQKRIERSGAITTYQRVSIGFLIQEWASEFENSPVEYFGNDGAYIVLGEDGGGNFCPDDYPLDRQEEAFNRWASKKIVPSKDKEIDFESLRSQFSHILDYVDKLNDDPDPYILKVVENLIKAEYNKTGINVLKYLEECFLMLHKDVSEEDLNGGEAYLNYIFTGKKSIYMFAEWIDGTEEFNRDIKEMYDVTVKLIDQIGKTIQSPKPAQSGKRESTLKGVTR